jgi:hypothetical protein
MINLSMTLFATGLAVTALGLLALSSPLAIIGLGVSGVGYLMERDRG